VSEFGAKSLARLAELHPDLQRVLCQAIKVADFAIICGHRGEKDQDVAYATGHSRLQWPYSKHNALPALAVDVAPWPINWDDLTSFYYLAGVVMTCAYKEGVPLTWGGNWIKLKDMPHFELKDTAANTYPT
jgi:peptidoglycan L-alanyl-D-glutamate endopeptidase CwlK